MEMTALEATRDSFGEENIQFETIQGAELRLGGGEGSPDRETLSTRFCININAKAFVHAENGFTREVHVQLWITPTQIAQLVREYFTDMLRYTPRVYRDLLERILRKRWQVMTSSLYRENNISGTERVKPYHKTRP